MYTPKYKPNQLIIGEGDRPIIISGWTPRAAVAKKLSPSGYAAIGNLYSPTRGLSPLIRNLSLNPQIRDLVILDATREDANAGGCQCLWDFFAHGFDEGETDTRRPAWVVRSEVRGFIDIEIPEARLNLIRASVRCRRVRSMSELMEAITEMPSQDENPWGEPGAYPEPTIAATTLPSPRYGHRVEGETIAETWVKILHRIKSGGTVRPTGYDDNWQELIDLTAVVTDEPLDFYFPEPNYLPIDRAYLAQYIPQMVKDAPYVEGVKYSYGQRLRSWFGRDQVEQVIDKLTGEIDAASAVMSLWDVKDHETGGSPCLNHIWVRVVDGELSLTATFRSNDMFSAWPANAMGLRELQVHIWEHVSKATALPLSLGPLITISQSAHIYGDTWENVDRLIAQQYATITRRRRFDDPVGNFVVERHDHGLVATQSTPGSGESVRVYKGRSPLKIMREIVAANPAIQPDHIGYIAIELERLTHE